MVDLTQSHRKWSDWWYRSRVVCGCDHNLLILIESNTGVICDVSSAIEEGVLVLETAVQQGSSKGDHSLSQRYFGQNKPVFHWFLLGCNNATRITISYCFNLL